MVIPLDNAAAWVQRQFCINLFSGTEGSVTRLPIPPPSNLCTNLHTLPSIPVSTAEGSCVHTPVSTLFSQRNLGMYISKNFVSKQRSEKIRYLDFCSLYPYCVKNKPFVVGHLVLYLGDDCPQISELFGMFENNIMFPLCRSCMEQRRNDLCKHENVKDRCFTGTFVTEEVKLAIEQRLVIVKMYMAL
ncbi:hypothetical protein B566_EDAN014833 [Ephemera danica]|nr:hypothetical protein B566_EDAN014833 [Ephemera danica]